MTRERVVFQTGPKHRVTLNIVFIIEKMKEKRTQPQKRPMDQMKHNLIVVVLQAKVQVEQIATEIQSADSVTSNT